MKLAGRNKREAERQLEEFREQLPAFPGWGSAAIDPELSREHGQRRKCVKITDNTPPFLFISYQNKQTNKQANKATYLHRRGRPYCFERIIFFLMSPMVGSGSSRA